MIVSKEAMMCSYIFTFALLLAVMTNVCQYFYFHRPRHADCWRQYGPVVLMAVSTLLLLISPIKSVVVNISLLSFKANGFDPTIETMLDLAYNPAFTEVRMRHYTTLAYGLMLWGTAMQTDLVDKFRVTVKGKQRKACDNPAG
jgi:hypothetical protein